MELRFCNICYENKLSSDFLNVPTCGHLYCKDCLRLYFQSILQSREFFNLKCPFITCGNKELDSLAKLVLSSEEYELFDKENYRFILSLDPNIRWCPMPDCKGYAQISSNKQVSCNICFGEFCKVCSQIWQKDHKCVKSRDFFTFMQNLGAKTCPGCKNLVEKKSGCTNMTCRCGTNFCMMCGSTINEKHDGFKCMLGLDSPTWTVIFILLLSLVLFPFHFAFYMVSSQFFDVKNEEGLSVYTVKNVLLYTLMFVVSPFVEVLVLIFMCGHRLFNSNDKNINSYLPRGKWFWPIKPILWVSAYVLMFVIGISFYMVANLYLTILGVIALVKKIGMILN